MNVRKDSLTDRSEGIVRVTKAAALWNPVVDVQSFLANLQRSRFRDKCAPLFFISLIPWTSVKHLPPAKGVSKSGIISALMELNLTAERYRTRINNHDIYCGH